MSRGINEEQRQEIETLGRDAVEFARFSLKLFEDVVLKNSQYLKIITGDTYVHRTYNMGTVDENNRSNFYDGKIRVVGPDGRNMPSTTPRTTANTWPSVSSRGPT